MTKRTIEHQYYVYMLSSESGVLYTGVTHNLERRIWQHKNKIVNGFTSRYKVNSLVYFKDSDDIGAVIAREKEIKGWVRKKKIALINEVNPKWKALSMDFMDNPISCHTESR